MRGSLILDKLVKGVENVRMEHTRSNTLLLDKDITRQEVVWALGRLKGKAAPRKDAMTSERINSVILVDFGQ